MLSRGILVGSGGKKYSLHQKGVDSSETGEPSASKKPLDGLFLLRSLELQVEGIDLGGELGVFEGKVPADQQDSKPYQGIPAKGNLSPSFVPCDVEGRRSHDYQGDYQSAIPDPAKGSGGPFAPKNLFTIHEEEKAQVGYGDQGEAYD